MLIPTIKFEIRNFKNGTAEQFLVENTELHYALIAASRFTRDIKFGQTFDFQFDRERNYPEWFAFATTFIDAVVENCGGDVELTELDEIDEMVGTF